MGQVSKDRKSVYNAWAFYDWANSVYSLVISSTIFPLYYGALFREINAQGIEFLGVYLTSEALIGYLTAVCFIIVAIISPFLSAIADYLGNKKTFMKAFCLIGSLSCMGLYFFSLSHIYFGVALYMLGLIGFWGSLVFYNSYLPDIAPLEDRDALSAKGFALGYVGSVLLLLINLALVMKFEFFGFSSPLQAMRASFVLVGVWWLGFSMYTFNYLPSFKNSNTINRSVFFKGFRELKSVYAQVKSDPLIKGYLIAFFVYSMAVQTVMIIAAYYGEKEIAWQSDSQRTTGLILSILAIQLVAIFGAFATSKLSNIIGNIYTLMVLNAAWIGICCYAYTIITPNEFYIAAALVGLVMGGIQSMSRSTYSKMIPSGRDTTSFFSFYDVTEKIGIVLGMLTYAMVSQYTGKMQNAILFLILFFIAGLLLLFRLKKSIKQRL